MRIVDLAIYADSLAAEAASISARLERARGRLRRAAIEHEARRALPAETVALLECRGLLGPAAPDRTGADAVELHRLGAELAAIERAQAWVEYRLLDARASAEREQEVTMAA